MTYDVIIVGASYAGLATAIALRGRRVLLIDRHPVGAHQTSACGTLLAVVEALGLEHTVHAYRVAAQHDRRAPSHPVALPRPALRISPGLSRELTPLACTFDHASFCRTLRQRTDAEFVRATVHGRDSDTVPNGVWRPSGVGSCIRGANAVMTDRGSFQGDILIDASGWGAVLTACTERSRSKGRANCVARGAMSFGLEMEIPAPPSEGLQFWYEPDRLVPRGVTWLFPCGRTSRFGIGSYAGDTQLKARLVRFLATDFGLAPGAIHGTYWPYGSRPTSTDGIFRVGDAAGHCLPFTGEGIRPALYFGLACGQIVRQVLDGDYSLEEGLELYRRFVARHR